jgi:hypothetical protein
MTNLKRKVRNAVQLYKQTFKEEYDLVLIQIDQARRNNKTDFGEVVTEDGSKHAIKREVFRVPEKLYTIIMSNLSDDEILELDTKEYAHWFIHEFPQFKMTKDA